MRKDRWWGIELIHFLPFHRINENGNSTKHNKNRSIDGKACRSATPLFYLSCLVAFSFRLFLSFFSSYDCCVAVDESSQPNEWTKYPSSNRIASSTKSNVILLQAWKIQNKMKKKYQSELEECGQQADRIAWHKNKKRMNRQQKQTKGENRKTKRELNGHKESKNEATISIK